MSAARGAFFVLSSAILKNPCGYSYVLAPHAASAPARAALPL
jgi:hypothetical protein